MCCLFGLIDYRGTLTAKQKTRLIRELSIAEQRKGHHGTHTDGNAGQSQEERKQSPFSRQH